MPVSDATPLIYLAKIGKLNLLRELFGQVQIPPEVRKEVVDRGKEKGYPDAISIERAIDDGWLVTHPLTGKEQGMSKVLAQVAGIDIGEAQTIFLAKRKNEREVLIDQTNAREAALQLNLTPRGTIYVVIVALKKKMLTKEEAVQMLDRLIEANFYMSVEIYRGTLKAIEEL